MSIGIGLVLIAVGAILRFGVSTVSTHGISIHTIGDILMLVGVLGVVLWLAIWAPWARRRRVIYQREALPGEIPPGRRYPVETRYEDDYRASPYQDDYRP